MSVSANSGLPNPGGWLTPTVQVRASNNCYSVQSPAGASFCISCNPTASFTGSYGNVEVSYSATATPVTINLGGTNNPSQGDYRVLTGQQITAALQGPNGFNVAKYTWSQPSATCFKTYNPASPSNQLMPLGTSDLSGPAAGSASVAPLAFYDSKQESLTLNCAVTMTAPDGTVLNVTATSPSITVEKPTAYWTTNSDDPSLGPQFSQQAMGYDEKWDAAITIPSPFSGGFGCFAQTVQPTTDFQRHPTGKQSINCYYEIPQKNADGTTTYVLPGTGLDAYFPYQNSSTTHYPQGYVWNVSSPGQSGDAPGVSFSIGVTDNGGNNWYNAFSSDTFTTWLMYLPPVPAGSGPSIWIPLQSIGWGWSGNVVKDNATGQWNTAVNSQAPVTGFTSSTGIPTDTPPQWSSVITGTNVLYPLY